MLVLLKNNSKEKTNLFPSKSWIDTKDSIKKVEITVDATEVKNTRMNVFLK